MLKYYLKKIKHFAEWPNHSPKRLANRIANYASRLRGGEHVFGLPSVVMIEISSACQLRCPLCPTGSQTLDRVSQVMPLETFKKIVDELGEYLYHININGMGEPLLNNQIVEMVRYAKSKNIFVDLYTNFEITDKHGIIEGLVDAGLDSILIAIDGATPEIYEEYRIRGNFERVTGNVKKLVQARKEAGKSKPEINIQFVPMKQNHHQMKDMTQLARDLGADMLEIKRPFLFWGQKADALKFLPNDEKFNMYNINGDTISWKGEEKAICEFLWTSSVILPNGAVTPCCFDYEGSVTFGNINESNFTSVWNGKKYKAFRKVMKKSWRNIPLCSKSFEGGCPNMFMQPDDWLIAASDWKEKDTVTSPTDSSTSNKNQ